MHVLPFPSPFFFGRAWLPNLPVRPVLETPFRAGPRLLLLPFGQMDFTFLSFLDRLAFSILSFWVGAWNSKEDSITQKEKENRNTTQRRRKPSNATKQKRGRERSPTQRRERKAALHKGGGVHPGEQCSARRRNSLLCSRTKVSGLRDATRCHQRAAISPVKEESC